MFHHWPVVCQQRPKQWRRSTRPSTAVTRISCWRLSTIHQHSFLTSTTLLHLSTWRSSQASRQRNRQDMLWSIDRCRGNLSKPSLFKTLGPLLGPIQAETWLPLVSYKAWHGPKIRRKHSGWTVVTVYVSYVRPGFPTDYISYASVFVLFVCF